MRSYPIPFLTFILIGILAIGAIAFSVFQTATAASLGPQQPPSSFAFIPMIVFAMIIASFGFWIFALIHLLTNKAIQGTDQIVWLLVVILLHALGAVLYFFVAPQPFLASLPPHLRQNQNA